VLDRGAGAITTAGGAGNDTYGTTGDASEVAVAGSRLVLFLGELPPDSTQRVLKTHASPAYAITLARWLTP
jgi:hypothetical protein